MTCGINRNQSSHHCHPTQQCVHLPGVSSAKLLGEDNMKQVQSLKSNFNRIVNSQYQNGAGKMKQPKTISPIFTPSARTCRGVKQKYSTPPDARSTIYHGQDDHHRAVSPFNASDNADPLLPIEHSIQAPHYKRLLPSELVRIFVGAEILVVVPTVTKATVVANKIDINNVTNRFDCVIVSMCRSHLTIK